MGATAVIVQARFSSTRLPGKVLLNLDGRSALWHVLTRCQMIGNADVVCCAIPEGAGDDAVAAEAERAGAVVFRGSRDDVLDRYYQAARFVGADTVLRVTSDCPLIDPTLCSTVIERLREAGATFACNNRPVSWPHGLDCEAFSTVWLARAAREETRPVGREHVSEYFVDHPDARIVNVPGRGERYLDHRWTLDYPEDLAFFRALFAVLSGDAVTWSTQAVVDLLAGRPDIAVINACHHHKDRDPASIPTHDATR